MKNLKRIEPTNDNNSMHSSFTLDNSYKSIYFFL